MATKKQMMYNELALRYAEEHGIMVYRVEKNLMIYNQSYRAYLSNPRYTIQKTVNLDIGKEVGSRKLARFDKKGYLNC